MVLGLGPLLKYSRSKTWILWTWWTPHSILSAMITNVLFHFIHLLPLHPLVCRWTIRLCPFLAIENSAVMNIVVPVSFLIIVLSGYMPRNGNVWLFATSCTIQSIEILGQNTGVGSLSLLPFPTQGSNPGLPHCRRILYQLSHKESPRILEWVAVPFSRGSSWPRNWTGVSCIAGGFFTNWAIREYWRG